MSGTFPLAKPDWANLDVVRKGTLPPRSYFFLYDSENTATKGGADGKCSVPLSGTWKFQHSNSPFEAPESFETPGFDTANWSDIQVPGHWQLQGWGHPHYTNVNYIIPVDPPNVPYEDNQTGSYVKRFTVPESFRDQQLRLRFEGVDSAYHVYVNGKEVGYCTGSRNSAEFDITELVDPAAENTLAVRVYQWSVGSYLEDQDQWRFSGIYRDVYLVAFPSSRIEDFHVQTSLDDHYNDADLNVKVTTTGEGPVEVKLLDQNGSTVVSGIKQASKSPVDFSFKVQSPVKWSAEQPTLYSLILSYSGRYVRQNVGFRRIEIVNGIYMINGRRIVFRGANRHEHHPKHGRAVPYEFMEHDLRLMKLHNLNAVRTCHQPTDPRMYDLADRLGLWIMDEADVECHGFATIDEQSLPEDWQHRSFEEKKAMVYGGAGRWTSDNPDWEPHYVDRAKQLVARDKNHPCVIMWSLGNEAFYGRNFQSMYNEIRSVDKSRPVHYEGDAEAKTVDLYSQMYPTVESIIKFAKEKDFTKPLVLCEFIHAMGNGPGNIKEYIDAFYEYPRLQGGWVWEWANHGLEKTDPATGEHYMAYGGDFGDVPNDYNFIMDGVLFSNHTPTPGLTEYRKAIEPVQVKDFKDGKVTIINRYDIMTLDNHDCTATLVGDGFRKSLGPLLIPENVQPHTEATITVPGLDVSEHKGEIYLQLDFSLKLKTLWSEAGHITSTSQVQLQRPLPLPVFPSSASTAPSVTRKGHILEIATSTSTLTFSLVSGALTSWVKRTTPPTQLIDPSKSPMFSLNRAQTDNDRPQDGRDWTRQYLPLAQPHVRSVSWTSDASSTSVAVESRHAPPVLSWSLATTMIYKIHNSGQVHVSIKSIPDGLNLPKTLPRFGLELNLPGTFTNVAWFGRGPGESYRDKKLSQHFGNYSVSKIDDLFVDYEFPQENGNRTDVRWVELAATASSGGVITQVTQALGSLSASKANNDTPIPKATLRASFPPQDNYSFSASHYTASDLETAKHPFELKKIRRDYVVLRLDGMHHGIGTGSCGPKTLDEYALKVPEVGKGVLEMEVLLE
jgi:beta-galactosidase